MDIKRGVTHNKAGEPYGFINGSVNGRNVFSFTVFSTVFSNETSVRKIVDRVAKELAAGVPAEWAPNAPKPVIADDPDGIVVAPPKASKAAKAAKATPDSFDI